MQTGNVKLKLTVVTIEAENLRKDDTIEQNKTLIFAQRKALD